MSRDARFADGGEAPLNLRAESAEDLAVMAALVQDAVLPVSEIRYEPKARRLSMLLNRFRWEDKARAEAEGRAYERVQALFVISDVLKVASQGFDRRDSDLVLSVLDIAFEPGEEGAGRVVLVLAGDGALAAEVECLALDLRDVTRPYGAVSGQAPQHPE
ncbi:hypothetical protein C8J27_108150 [Rhodobacter aestuarii]|uniref:DUF2948 domain-containing protein n=1 Tax=Rhodobacter aestuarii TaxID=453582 RepID=A0A1N7PH90_9RHOB|nr:MULTISPECIES: DUF2948 family protein [Rhodobacter]PTV94414.1 hypothetical protein C8J27_108150 [Rhodobacter aestuarii]SIT09984.1 Protein of unknown function [Rhodobacter aestuarii]SOC03633.1 hypothetical protein SAMN05877809_10320 [Rhodobacter sp. JA431]